MDVTIGVSLVLLMAAFVVISVYYFRKQARALEYMAEVEETRFMRQQQIWRREDAAQIDIGAPMAWLADVASAALGDPVSLTNFRAIPELPAVEAIVAGGGRLVFSPLTPRALRRKVGGARGASKDAAGRMLRMAGDAPLLGRNPRRAQSAERSLMHDEWFDIKAGKAGQALGLDWGEPSRLWVYSVAANA